MKKNEITVAMTGASGNMGQAAVKEVMTLPYVKLRLLLLDGKKEKKLLKNWKKQYGDRVDAFFGNMKNEEDCKRLVENADYVVNMAAVIPPMADKYPDLAYDVNVTGVKNIVNAIQDLTEQPKFIHISTVAIYGHRNHLHPWGRVGDPLMPSAYDEYGMGKLIGERYVLDSEIKNWAILRQTGMLYEKLLTSNVSDGLMFHTNFNVPIEWASDHDSGVLIKNIVAKDYHCALRNFGKRVYNIGGGEKYRTTGFEFFNMGFDMIGGSVEKFMKPNWQATRNFHCMWFSDSDELEEMFHFRSGSLERFWSDVKRKNWYFSLARILPAKAISAMVIRPLLKDENAPYRWVKEGNEGRTNAFFGSKEEWEKIGEDWEDFALWNKNQIKGHDYQKEIDFSYAEKCRLSHGYDESKDDSELTLADLQSAAKFRGGKCLAKTFKKGDWYQKVAWQCAEGHIFFASPYTVLKAGHWCPHCIREHQWDFDRLAKKNPFYAQVWYDSHDRTENALYYVDENGESAMAA